MLKYDSFKSKPIQYVIKLLLKQVTSALA